MGKLMVIDGLDGSGKSTQLALLEQYCADTGIKCRQISFPDYGQPSSALVKMYLGGELGGDANAVSAYAASSFYAVDRYASYRRFWESDYLAGVPVLAARYVSSNAIHQMTKLPREQWDDFLLWLGDYEYGKLGLPQPDTVVFLDMPTAVSQQLLRKRYDGDEGKKDIHERDTAYLDRCREAALYVAKKQGWQVIPCSAGDAPRPVEDIHRDLKAIFDGWIKGEGTV